MVIVLKPSVLLLFEPQDEKIGSTQYESLCPELLCIWGSFWLVYGADFGSTVSTGAFMLLVKQESSPEFFLTHRTPCVRSKMVCIINEDKRKPRPGISSPSSLYKDT